MDNNTKQQVEKTFKEKLINITATDVERVWALKEEIENKIGRHSTLNKYLDKAKIMYALLQAYRKGIYRAVPWTSIAAIVGALLYVFSPIDLIPDVIPIIGLTDDAFVIALCLMLVDHDLMVFDDWRKSQVTA